MTEQRLNAVEIHHSPVLLPDRQQALDRRHRIRKDRQEQLGHRILPQDRRRARKTRLSALSGLKFHYEHVLKKPWVATDLIKPLHIQRLPDIMTVAETERIFLATQVLSYRVFFTLSLLRNFSHLAGEMDVVIHVEVLAGTS